MSAGLSRKQGDAEGPIRSLRAFKRVSIPAGKTVNVEFDLKDKELQSGGTIDPDTVRVCRSTYHMYGGRKL
ncbi:MAG: fibronectin type III-like domain-contianing protein [Bacteroides cellulosilyticus]